MGSNARDFIEAQLERREKIFDPGGRSRFPLLPGIKGRACFAGENARHRLWLQRGLDDGTPSWESPFAHWTCMNPSTAGADEDDPLVRKAWEFTRRMGLAHMILTNAGTYRCTDPSLLPRGVPLSHRDNLDVTLAISRQAAKVVVACGNPPDVLFPHATAVIATLRDAGLDLWCLGRTQAGWPRHPGRLAYATKVERF